MFIGLGVLIAGVVIGGAAQSEALMGVAVLVGYIWLMVGFVYYRVHSFRYMAENRRLGDQITFTATPTTGEVIKIYIIGALIMAVVVAVLVFIGGLLFGAAMSVAGIGNMGLVGVLGVVLYLIALVLLGAMALVFITQPTIAHFITNFTVHNADALNDIQQRAMETGVDAEGFADALDIGGAI